MLFVPVTLDFLVQILTQLVFQVFFYKQPFDQGLENVNKVNLLLGIGMNFYLEVTKEF